MGYVAIITALASLPLRRWFVQFVTVSYIAPSLEKAASIFLILTQLLNIFGYHGFFLGWEVLNAEEVHSALDSDVYAGSEAITLRIPLTLPYPLNQDNYERVNGMFEYEGSMYRLVKQKMYNDTLYIICSKDKVGKYIQNAIEELGHSMNEDQATSKAGSGKAWPNALYDFHTKRLDVSPSLTALKIIDSDHHAPTYSNPYHQSIDHPPA